MGCVLAVAVAASWPALKVGFGTSDAASLRSQSTQNPTPSAPAFVPPAPSSTSAPPPPVTLSVLAPKYPVTNDQHFWDETVQQFQIADPGITVTVKQVDPSALVAEARTELAAGTVDLVLGAYPDDVRDATASGRLYQQFDVVPPSLGVLPGFTYHEEGSGPGGNPGVFGIPFTGSTLELYCNAGLFVGPGIAEPPKAWAELAADAAKIKAGGKIGYGLAMAPGDAAATAQMWMMGDGGSGFSAGPGNRFWSVNMPGNVKALRWLADNLVKPGLTEPHPETQTMQDVEQQFLAGNVGMMIADSRLFPLAQTHIAGALRVVPMPGLAGPVDATVGSVDDFLAANTRPERKDAISKFLAYLLAEPSDTSFADIHGTLPLTRAGVKAESSDPRWPALLGQLGQVTWLPTRAPAWPKVQAAISADLSKALTGDPQAVLDRIQAVATAASPPR